MCNCTNVVMWMREGKTQLTLSSGIIILFYRSDYIPFDVTRRPGRVQEEYKPGSGHIDLGTTYKMDYNPYKVQAFVAARPKERLHATGAKLDTMPTYKGVTFYYFILIRL